MTLEWRGRTLVITWLPVASMGRLAACAPQTAAETEVLAALLAGARVILYCSGDGTRDAKTPEALRDELVSIGCRYDQAANLRALAERLGIPREKVMALGDNGNDVTMLQYAGVSVAMGDGSPEAKAAARFLTAPHDQNGLAQAVRQYALS